MPGQGITVSILAKIEGWQELIKLIQNAMKNIKPGTDISKSLVKDLQLVNDMVNNLGKNMNQRLTSDSLITGFVDKIMLVEEVFGRLGTSMSHISFGDINPEYITAGFKDLLSTLELANNALGQGMESSFQNAIANSKTLLKEFARMKIDPKTMNIDAIKEALAERGKSLEKDVNDGLKKLTDFEKGLEKLKNARDELIARDKFLGKDVDVTAQSLLIGHQLPTEGTILDSDELEKQLSFFRSNLLKAGFTPTQLGRIIPDLESVMKAGHWDEMPSKFTEYLREAQNRTRNSLEKASLDYGAAVLLHLKMAGALSHLSALRFNNTLAQNEVGNILSGTVLNDTRTLKDVVNNLKQQLEQAVTSSFKGLGSKLFSSSLQGIQDASAAMKDYSAALDLVKAKEQAVSKVLGVVLRYFSIYAAVRMVSKGIRSMMNTIKELDKTITEIAIVTKMDQNDLWGLMPLYTKLAKNYAASISGVYKVSQLYYQQGLGQLDVMALTELTLKMARISGLDYAEATDYMTNAVRSFKMEMTDAATVVDVYSAVAASSASSVTELATAMSKTASSAAAVGSSFENTTAMLAVMIEATRESPENIGSAMKSIISRYGELKENKTGIDSEGEEYSLNKVDKALLTVGISIHDVNGEFRDFDDVIFELAEKWNTIDKNTLRYIATVMAGNRLQSRFLALVSSTERLKEESEKAANSEDASQLQFLKTMDSIEAKTQLFQTSLLSLYTSSGLEKLYKGLLDFGNEFANTLENISSKNGLVGAISNVGASFLNMATFATTGFNLIKTKLTLTKLSMERLAKNDVVLAKIDSNKERLEVLDKTVPRAPSALQPLSPKELKDYDTWKVEHDRLTQENTDLLKEIDENTAYSTALQKRISKSAKLQGWGMAASAAGMALSAWANTIDINENRGLKGGLTMGSSALLGLGTGLMVGASAGGPLGALVGVLTALPGVLLGAGMLTESTAERILKLEKNITEASNERIKSKDELKTLEDYKKKYDELSKSLYESAEKKKEFMELSNSIAASYPELIKSMDAEGNYVINMAEGYERLANAKREAYKEDIITEMGTTISGLEDIDYVLKNVYGKNLMTNNKFLLDNVDLVEDLLKIDYTQSTDAIRSAVRDKLNYGAISLIDSRGGNTADRLFLTDGKSLIGNLIFPNYNTDQVTDIYMALFELAQLKIDLVIAKENVKSQFEGKYDDLIESFDTNFYDELLLRLLIPDILKDLVKNRTSRYTAEYINLIADSADAVFNTESTDLTKRFAKTLLQDEWDKEYDKLKAKLDEGETIDWSTEISNFYKSHEEFWYNLLLESDELKGIDSLAEEFYKTLGLHTKKDIENLFPEIDETGLEGEALEAAKKNNEIAEKRRAFFRKIYEEDYDDIIDNYNNWLKDKDIINFKVNDYSEKVGSEYLTQIQSQYKNIISNTGLSEKLITDLVQALNDITDFITSDNFTFDLRNALLTKYSATDFSSLFGILTFIDSLADLDLDMDELAAGGLLKALLKTFGSTISTNITTEIDSYVASLTKSFLGLDKDLSSVTSGMNLKDAAEMGEKLKIALKDFTVRDGKFYLDDLSSIVEYYDKINNEYEEALNESITDKKGKFEKMQDFFTLFKMNTGEYEDIDKWTEGQLTWINDLYGILYTELKYYYDKFLDYLKDKNNPRKVFYDFLIDDLDSALEDGTGAIKQWATLLKSISSLKTLGYDAFIEASGLSKFGEESSLTILKAARDLNFEVLKSTNEDLYNAVSPYISTLISFFKDSETSIINSLIDVTGTGKNASITVSTSNKDYLKELLSVGLFEGIDFDSVDIIGLSLLILVDKAEGAEEIILQLISEKFTTDAEKLEAYQKYHVNKYKNNKLTNFGKITENIVSYEDFTNYLSTNIGLSANTIGNPAELARAAKMYGLAMNAAGDFYIEDWTTRIALLNADLLTLLKSNNGASIEEINEVRVKLLEAELGRDLTLRTAVEDILKNYNDISITQLQALANALGSDIGLLEKALYLTNTYGKTTVNLGVFKNLLNSHEYISDATRNYLLTLFSSITDDYLKNIDTATSLVTKGTTSRTDILDFISLALASGLTDIDESVFKYDDLLNAWTLDATVLYNYVLALALTLIDAGLLTTQLAEDYINNNVNKVLANEIDVSQFFKAEYLGTDGLSYLKLYKLLNDYISLLDDSLIEASIQSLKDNKIVKLLLYPWETTDDNATKLTKAYMEMLSHGGEDAVAAMYTIMEAQGKEVQSADILAAYTSELERIEPAFELLAYGEGSLISGAAKQIIASLEEAGYEIQELDDNNAVILLIGDISLAYQAYYDQLLATGEATLASLNEAMAKVYETKGGRDKEQIAIDMLDKAMGMTYTEFGEILANLGISMTEDLMAQLEESLIISSIGGNLMRILDFNALAESLNWDFNSETYLKALKAYNDSYIQFTEEKLQLLMDEISALKDARGGSKINLTQYMHNLEQSWLGAAEALAERIVDSTAEGLKAEHKNITQGTQTDDTGKAKQFYNKVQEFRHKILNGFEATLAKYGASLNNGILTLEDNANLLGIATTLLTYAKDAGIELEGQLAELSDTITSILQSFVDILNKGIEGTLTATEALDLKNLASGFGINNISFDKTAEGLKLSETSAIRLYYALKEVDGLLATLVFDKLKTSLEETNEHFRSSTGLLGYIEELKTKINELSTVDNKVSLARLRLYKAELAVAQEIVTVRAGTEDSSFNFMSNKIPGAQNNPINYYNNWADALHKVRDALNTKSSTHTGPGGKRVMNQGLIDYQDWYNIVTEMGNLAEKSGEIKLSADWVLKNSEDAAKLIEASAAALTVDSNGLVKVALGNIAGLGMDFQTGATDMAKSIDTGIKAVAKSLVDMLNGIISMLELIVAMEQLGDIDIEGNGIDFSDIFEFKNTDDKNAEDWYNHIEGLSDKFNEGRTKVLDMLNKEQQDALKHTRFNLFGKDNSLYDLLDPKKDLDALFPDFQTAPSETKKAIAESYTNFIKGMYEMALSGDWDDLENLIGGFQKQLAQHGLDMSLLSYDVFDESGENVIRTITFAGTTLIEIDWEDPNVDDAVKRNFKERPQTEKTTIDEVRASFVKASKAYAEGKGATEGFTIEELVRINHKTKFEVVKDKNDNITGYKVDGKKVETPEEYYKAIAELTLKDAGVTVDTIKYTEEGNKTTGAGHIIINQEKGIKVEVKLGENGALEYSMPGPDGRPVTGDNLNNLYTNFYDRFKAVAIHYGAKEEELPTQEQYLYLTLGIHYVVNTKFTDKNNNEVTNDSAVVQNAVREWLDKKGTDLTETDYNVEGDTLTVQLGKGVTVDLLASKYQIDTKDGQPIYDNDAIVKDIQAMYNASSVENITAGVSAALANGIELKVSKDTTVGDLDAIKTKIEELDAMSPVIDVSVMNNTDMGVQSVLNSLAQIPNHKVVKVHATEAGGTVATGTIGLAKAQGTLMGELGPELVVSNGHYFVAGLNGPEMVDLADDAIVFNHLQTKSLLEKGMSRGRGQAVTNERNAVSFATGNIHGGPAMASASAALAALKQLRAQWQALAGMSAQDLAGKGGGGGGGGGDPKAFIKELERWYNYLQKIALLEKEISLEEAKRTTYASSFSRTGKDYYTSLVESLKKLKEQLATLIALNTEQEAYFNKRRKELNENSAFKALYSFDENGQLKYDQDKKYTNKNGEAVSAFEWLSDLAGRDSVTGEANYSTEEQYNKLVAMGYADQMKFDSSGNEIKQEGEDWYATAVLAFWDKIEAERQEMQELHDSIEDGKLKSQELQNLLNEILHEIEDNLIAVELKVLKAVEESRLRQIDELQDLRDAIEESSNKLIDGLSEQLSKEQEMYDNQLQSDDLAKLQRLLQILQRSGGSASLIADLQSLIAEKLQDMYFEMQLQLIDALQEASDNLLERLDHLIDIMTELLAYEKENGLLWDAVYEVLKGSPEDIAYFIQQNTSEYWGLSPTELTKNIREDLFEVDRFKALQEDVAEGVDLLKLVYNEEVALLEQEQKRKENEDYIRGLYKDLLGREAGNEEVAGWAEKMAQGMSAEDVKKGFLESTEYRKKHPDEYVASLYKELLGREGSAQEIKSWADLIRNGSKSVDEVRLGFLNSAEYKKKNGITDNNLSTTGNNKNNNIYYDPKTGQRIIADNESTVVKNKDGTYTIIKNDSLKSLKKPETITGLRKLAAGGLITQPTNALIGETGKPEAVLNPEQTRILRNNILSSRPDSLISLLKSYNEAYHGLSASTYDSISNNTNNATVIERAEVNLLVAQLANDYDSRRAANTIMDEMLRIASKTSANNSVRR